MKREDLRRWAQSLQNEGRELGDTLMRYAEAWDLEVERLRADAERLEWLVNPAHGITRVGSEYRTLIHPHVFMSDWYEDFRAAIDAARMANE